MYQQTMTKHNKITITETLKLDSGEEIADFEIAYQAWGKLNDAKDKRHRDFPRINRRSICLLVTTR